MARQFFLATLKQVREAQLTVIHLKKEVETLEIRISDLVPKLEMLTRLTYVGFENKTSLEKVQNWSDMGKPITSPDIFCADLVGKLTEEPKKLESSQSVFPTMDGLDLVAANLCYSSPRGSLLQLEKKVLWND